MIVLLFAVAIALPLGECAPACSFPPPVACADPSSFPRQLPETPPLLGAGLIVKDESETIVRTLSSLRNISDISSVVLVDTGSTDGTQRVFADFCAAHSHLSCFGADTTFDNFAQARNDMLAVAATVTDILLLLDANDFLVHPPNRWRASLADRPDHVDAVPSHPIAAVRGVVARREAGSLEVQQDWFSDAYSSTTFRNIRLLALACGYTFKRPVHEFVSLEDDEGPAAVNESWAWCRASTSLDPDVVVAQDRSTGAESSGFRLRWDKEILLREAAQHPDDARSSFYLANTLSSLGEHEAAHREYVRRVTLGDFQDEVDESLLSGSRALSALGEHERALAMLEDVWTMGVRPEGHQALVALVASAGIAVPGEARRCVAAAQRAMDCMEPFWAKLWKDARALAQARFTLAAECLVLPTYPTSFVALAWPVAYWQLWRARHESGYAPTDRMPLLEEELRRVAPDGTLDDRAGSLYPPTAIEETLTSSFAATRAVTDAAGLPWRNVSARLYFAESVLPLLPAGWSGARVALRSERTQRWLSVDPATSDVHADTQGTAEPPASAAWLLRHVGDVAEHRALTGFLTLQHERTRSYLAASFDNHVYAHDADDRLVTPFRIRPVLDAFPADEEEEGPTVRLQTCRSTYVRVEVALPGTVTASPSWQPDLELWRFVVLGPIHDDVDGQSELT